MHDNKPTIVISSCLLGEHVRYDGRDKQLPYLYDVLSKACHIIPLCPEVTIGMPVPRPPIQVIIKNQQHYARGVENNSHDVTDDLHHYCQQHSQLQSNACGYILKSRSPSCGTGNTPIYSQAEVQYYGDGIFTEQLKKIAPYIPIINEDKLADPQQRDQFLEAIFIYQKLLNCKTLQQQKALKQSLYLTYVSRGNMAPSSHSNQEVLIKQTMTLLQQPNDRVRVYSEIIKLLSLDINTERLSQDEARKALLTLQPALFRHPLVKQQHYLCPSPIERWLRFEAPVEKASLQLIDKSYS